MKSRITFLSILLVSVAFAASAQEIEYDDMYFRSKDRVVLAASRPLTMNTFSRETEVVSPINPTDSYSARNVNPEYLSQSRVNPSVKNQGSVAYFTPDYMPTSVNQNIYNNPGFSNYRGSMMNPFFGSGMGMGMMPGFGSPFNNFYSPWGYDPYGFNSFNNYGWGSGLSIGMGFGGWNTWGSPWNNCCGMNNWGWNSGFNNGGWNSWNNGWNRPIVIINNGDSNGRHVVYGKRSSRSNDLNNNVATGSRSTATVGSQSRTRESSSSGGRVASSDNNAGSYYQRGWRANPETNTTRSTWSSGSRTSDNSSNTFYNSGSNSRSNSGSFFNDSGSGSRSSSWSGGGSNFSSGGGSRSGGGGSTGGGGRSSSGGRGRN